jgi:hypothetical protein
MTNILSPEQQIAQSITVQSYATEVAVSTKDTVISAHWVLHHSDSQLVEQQDTIISQIEPLRCTFIDQITTRDLETAKSTAAKILLLVKSFTDQINSSN